MPSEPVLPAGVLKTDSPNSNGASYHAPVSLPQPPALSAPPSMENLLAVIRRLWTLMLAFGVLAGLLIAGLVWALVPGKYSTSAVIQLPKVRGVTDDDTGRLDFQRSQAVFLKNGVVLNRVFKDDDEVAALKEVVRNNGDSAWLARNLTTDILQLGPDQLRLTLVGDHPDDIAVLLKKIIKAYSEAFEERQAEQLKVRQDHLKKKYAESSEALRKLRVELKMREKEAGLEDTTEVSSKQANLNTTLNELEKQKISQAQDRIKAQLKLDSVKAKLDNPAPVSDSEIDEGMRKDSRVSEMQKDLLVLDKQIAELQRTNGPAKQGPIKDLEMQRRLQQNKLEEIKNQVRSNLSRDRIDKWNENVETYQATIEEVAKMETYLDAKISKARADLATIKNNNLNPKAISLGVPQVRDEISQKEQTQRSINEEMSKIDIEGAAGSGMAVLEAPAAPSERRLDRKLKYALLGGGAAFGLVALGIGLLEFGKRRIYSTDDIARGLGLNLLGTLPFLPPAAREFAPLGVHEIPQLPEQADMQESIDSLRTLVLHIARHHHFRVLMITSPEPGEGKTALSCQLAVSLARAGQNTLLMDLDLRRPAAHLPFGLPLTPGFSEVLRGEAVFEKVIHSTVVKGLSMLPAGRVDRFAIQELMRSDLKKTFSLLEEHFDYIVIDTSPILPVADGLHIGGQVDAVILALMKNVSRLSPIYQAQQRLASVGIQVMGAVLTGELTPTYGRERSAAPAPGGGSGFLRGILGR